MMDLFRERSVFCFSRQDWFLIDSEGMEGLVGLCFADLGPTSSICCASDSRLLLTVRHLGGQEGKNGVLLFLWYPT